MTKWFNKSFPAVTYPVYPKDKLSCFYFSVLFLTFIIFFFVYFFLCVISLRERILSKPIHCRQEWMLFFILYLYFTLRMPSLCSYRSKFETIKNTVQICFKCYLLFFKALSLFYCLFWNPKIIFFSTARL